jgi:phosphonate transport system substrate-binding protein
MPKSRSVAICLLLFLLSINLQVGAETTIRHQPDQQPTTVAEWLNQQWQRLQDALKTKPTEPYQPTFGKHSLGGEKEYIVGIHPLHNPKRLFDVYGPIVDTINTRIPNSRFKLEASRNYEEFEKKLYNGHFDFAMPNPLQTIKSLDHGYRVFGKMADDQEFRGIILVRKDSGIHDVGDLKGKAVSYPAKTALAATLMPQYYLHTHGININTDIENRYVGSQESAIMNVLLGHVAAAATWPVPWKTFSAENPEQAAQLEVKWQTEALQNNGWVVRNDIPAPLADQFAAALFSLQESEAGQKLLAAVPVSRFETANDQTYAPAQAFLKVFSQTVRPLE